MNTRTTPLAPRLLVAVLLVLLLAACGGGGDLALVEGEDDAPPAAGTGSPRYRIALVMKTLTNPFFIEMERGAREAEAELGIELIVRTAAQETSIEQQITIVEDLTREGVDAIVIAPGDSLQLIPALKAAQDAGIVVVNIDNRLDPETMRNLGLHDVPFISVDNQQGAFLSANYLASAADGPTQAIILEGIRSAQNAQDRLAGAMRAFDQYPNIEVVAAETANWKIDEGYTVTAELFEAHPDVTLVFAANDMMALGAIAYLQEAGRTDVRVAAYDALDEAKAAIAEGTLAATIDQQAARQGYLGVEYAVRLLDGQTVPDETMVDVLLITEVTE